MAKIKPNPLPVLAEAQVKKAINDRLEYAQNQGQLIYLRLNSGDFIEVRGETRRRIKGTPKGTADFVVFQKNMLFERMYPLSNVCQVTFLEIKSSTGKQTQEQKIFEAEAEKMNCHYFIVRDADELVDILN